ncbi:Hsp70 family protein [Actinomycetes bacterium M1A6_2h]
MTSSDWLLSVDFGTSNTAAAHSAAVSGAVETLSLSHTSNLMSSAVFVDAPDRIAVGDHALNEAQRNPGAFLPSPKRLVGQPSIAVNGYMLPTSAPIAAVLRTVLSRATAAHAGQLPQHLVLTHPEAWSPSQVQTLIDAASGVMHPNSISTISEPRAAAAHYARSNRLADGTRIAVFDFGGGTLDVAVLAKSSDGTFTVLAARGDNGLGGKNLDALIRQWVDHQLDARSPDLVHYLRREAPAGVRQQLDDSIRRAKELLSEAPSATITAAGSGFHETLQLTRDEFDELISAPIDAAVRLTRATFADAGISGPDQISALYLTGGTSRIPLVHRALQQVGPVATLDDPKTVVAQGALSSWLAEHPSTPPMRGTDALMARWEQPQSPPPAEKSKSKTLPLVAAAVVAVIAAGSAVAFLATRDSGSDTQASASATTTSASGPVTLAATQDQILSAVPSALSADLTDCRQLNFTTNNALQISCYFTRDAPVVDGLVISTTDIVNKASIALTIDEQQARSEVVSNRQGGDPGDVVVENPNRTAAALVRPPGVEGTDGTIIRYANNSNFLTVDVYGLSGIDQGKTFLTRSGLVS